jgi:hypothetical protein
MLALLDGLLLIKSPPKFEDSLGGIGRGAAARGVTTPWDWPIEKGKG